MLVAIPSKGRAGKVTSLKRIPSGVLYVPEHEASEYRALYPSTRVVQVPNDVRGITRTRNWILDNTDDRHIVMIDDDLYRAGFIQLYADRSAHRKLMEYDWLESWQRLFDVTEGLGYRIFGVSTLSAPRAVYPYRPFIFHTYVTASCMGLINDGRTRFNEAYPVKEDYELCLRCIREDGGIVGARYLYWENYHWTGDGGCVDYRTQEMERLAIERLIAEYPGMIRRVVRGGSVYSIDLEF